MIGGLFSALHLVQWLFAKRQNRFRSRSTNERFPNTQKRAVQAFNKYSFSFFERNYIMNMFVEHTESPKP